MKLTISKDCPHGQFFFVFTWLRIFIPNFRHESIANTIKPYERTSI